MKIANFWLKSWFHSSNSRRSGGSLVHFLNIRKCILKFNRLKYYQNLTYIKIDITFLSF